MVSSRPTKMGTAVQGMCGGPNGVCAGRWQLQVGLKEVSGRAGAHSLIR